MRQGVTFRFSFVQLSAINMQGPVLYQALYEELVVHIFMVGIISELVHYSSWHTWVFLFPLTTFRISSISYSFKCKRLAVGARNGQVAVYDLKQGKTQMLNAHSHPVTVLLFSDDGKLLATYSYGDSRLCVWQVKCVHNRNKSLKFNVGIIQINTLHSTVNYYLSKITFFWHGCVLTWYVPHPQ